jgi:hypothetical protein
MSGVSENDPCKEYVLAAMKETAKEFKKSPGYSRLPDNDSDLDKKKKKSAKCDFEVESNDEDEDGFDPMSWTPLQDIIDSKPTFHVSA